MLCSNEVNEDINKNFKSNLIFILIWAPWNYIYIRVHLVQFLILLRNFYCYLLHSLYAQTYPCHASNTRVPRYPTCLFTLGFLQTEPNKCFKFHFLRAILSVRETNAIGHWILSLEWSTKVIDMTYQNWLRKK